MGTSVCHQLGCQRTPIREMLGWNLCREPSSIRRNSSAAQTEKTPECEAELPKERIALVDSSSILRLRGEVDRCNIAPRRAAGGQIPDCRPRSGAASRTRHAPTAAELRLP